MNGAEVELIELTPEDRPTLENLVQLYMYDFSEFDGGDVGSNGRFDWNGWTDFFAAPVQHVFLIRVDGKIAGFACASEDEAMRDPAERVWWMDEFFVMRKFRRARVGQTVAHELFDRLSGTWEVGQISTNASARAFWRKVIGDYTKGDFEEFEMNDDRWHGTVQYFRAST
jgi:predicted acetyltransferase